MNDISDEARIRRHVEEHGGPQGLNALDQWRWKGMNLPDVRRKDYSAEQEAQQDYVAVITAMENWGNWLRGQVEAMQADRKKLVDELNEELAAILDKVCDRLGGWASRIRPSPRYGLRFQTSGLSKPRIASNN